MRAADADVRRSRPYRSLLGAPQGSGMELTRTSPHPVSVWDVYFCGLVSMTLHPGFNKPDTPNLTVEECAKLADAMLEEREQCRG